MLGRSHILLLSVAVLFSENIRSAVSFTIPNAATLSSNLLLCSQKSSRSATQLSLSVDIEEDDFFSMASQSAAQERMQQLQDGESPLAVSLSTTTISSSDDSNSDVKIPNEPQLSSSSTKDNKRDEPSVIKVPIEPQLPKEPPTIQQVVQQIDSTQIIDDAEILPPTIITEGMTAEEAELVRKARLGDAVLVQEEEGETETPPAPVDEEPTAEEAEQTHVEKEDEEPTAEEAEEKRNARLDAADKVAQTLLKPLLKEEFCAQTLLKEEFPTVDGNDVTVKDDTEEDGDDTNTKSLYEEMIKVPIDPKKSTSDGVENTEEKKPIEPDDTKPVTDDDKSTSSDEPILSSSPPDSNGSKKLLSSDGKELYEPSQSALEMNQENVDMGLLVLTRAMLQLKAIVDKESSSKE